MNNFNFVAPYYNFLAGIIFGRSLYKAQIHFLKTVEVTDRVLLIGGGTGEIIREMTFQSLDFVEKSANMIERARQHGGVKIVHFIHRDFLSDPCEGVYDVIICPFFLDCFDIENLKKVLAICSRRLKTDGRLIVTDFKENGKNKLLIQVMYLFFRVTSRINARSLFDLQQAVSKAGFELEKHQEFRRGSLFSAIFRKMESPARLT